MTGPPDRPTLTIDLAAVRRNYRRLCKQAKPSRVAGVVKADGYGLGAVAIARELTAEGCRTFFVATLDEAIALRRAFDDIGIFVFEGPSSGQAGDFIEHHLQPAINHPEQLRSWHAAAADRGQRLRTAVHLDTGMCRLGFSPRQLKGIDRSLWDRLDLVLVMSHLASAEDLDDPLSDNQLERFGAMRSLLPDAPASLANSAGLFRSKAFQFDLCRPGIALYGGNPMPGKTDPMEPVVTVTAPVIQVHDIDAPGSVGYGATYPTVAGNRIATIGVGYADGVLRAAGNRATVRIGGVEVPIAGRISMDLTTLDVSSLPADAVRPGTVVEVISGAEGIDRFAEAAGTISYEVLTRLGSRLARRHAGGSGA